MDPIDVERAAVEHAFLLRFIEDRHSGSLPSLPDYQRLFPGHEEFVAHKYRELLSDDAVQERKIGRFSIQAELGRGGQAVVYRAVDPALGRSVALKVLSDTHALSEQALARFHREAAIAARLDHPGICTIYEVGRVGDSPFIAMRLVEGETLASHLHRLRREGSIPAGYLHSALRWIEQAARIICAAHAAGILHRDLKPGNLMITPQDEVVVLDFGLARLAESQESTLTASGDSLGTPAYMSPEQVMGVPSLIDHRTDVYSLAATLYECITLRRPFQSSTRDGLYRAILEDPVADPCSIEPGTPRDLAIVLMKALEKRPEDRYGSAAEFADEIGRVLRDEPVRARHAGPWLRSRRWIRRHPTMALSIVSLLVLLSAGLASGLFLLNRARLTTEENLRLADMRALLGLESAANEELWPAVSAMVPAMDRWLVDARALFQRLNLHRSHRSRIHSAAEGNSIAQAAGEAELRAFIDRLHAFATFIERIEQRRDLAETLAARTVEEHRSAWQATIADVSDRAANPRYRGLSSSPQEGLIPLGQDPVSGLFEFAHALSGAVPKRDPTSGRLLMEDDSAVVLILLPPGTFAMGATPANADVSVGPNVDRFCLDNETLPVHEITLDAFFLSKFEMTQGQWLRSSGSNPSCYFPGRTQGEHPTGVRLCNPVETVSWDDCAELLRRLDLILPTEAQWEYACRADTTTIWYSGDERASLAGLENLADEGSRQFFVEGFEFEAGLFDGFFVHAPVDAMGANPFGLHGTVGNVGEWCRDFWGAYLLPVVPGTGERICTSPFRAYRGGNFRTVATVGRSASRAGDMPGMRTHRTGVRPSRPLR